jgi:lipoprotein-releasing system permease protein
MRTLVIAILIAGCHGREPATPRAPALTAPTTPPLVDLRRVVIDVSGAVVILKSNTFADYRDIATIVAREPGVVSVEPMVIVEVTLRRNAHVAADLGLEGIALDRTPLASYITPRNPLGTSRVAPATVDPPPADFTVGKLAPADLSGTSTPIDVVIGAALAKTLDAHLGDLVESEREGLMSPDTWERGPPRHRQLRVVGIVTTNTPYDEHLIFTTLGAAQELVELGDVVTGLQVRITRAEDAADLAKKIEADLGGAPYEVNDWCNLNRESLHC